ncbi:hypothetical protein M514_00896, partial [Trichuris suis]
WLTWIFWVFIVREFDIRDFVTRDFVIRAFDIHLLEMTLQEVVSMKSTIRHGELTKATWRNGWMRITPQLLLTTTMTH